MIKYLLLLLPLLGFSSSITMDHAMLQPLGKMIQTNAEITQLSEQKQEIVSRLSGHVERYFISAGQHVKNGDKIALIESIELSRMSAEYVSLLKQTKASKAQLTTAKTLHTKGLSSQNDISNAIITLEEIYAKQNALTSQLKSLGIKPETLTEATDKYTLYAHADGIVGEILAPLHSNVNAQTSLMTLVNQSGYYAVAYLGVKDAMNVTPSTKGWISISGLSYPCQFTQLLPEIDKETQRAKVLFKIGNSPANLLLGAYTQMDISLAPTQEVIMVKKSALTLFKGEWVVFVEADHEAHQDEGETHDHDKHENLIDNDQNDHTAHESEEKHQDEHENHDHAKHENLIDNDQNEHKAHESEEKHQDEHGHDAHEEEELPFNAKVVEVIAYNGENVAVKGLKVGESYVSDGVYFVKSMLLRSSLGGHGH